MNSKISKPVGKYPGPWTRYQRYNKAYGDYSGGYGPSGNFDRPQRFGPPPGFMPPPPNFIPPPPPLMAPHMMGRGFRMNGPPRKFDDRPMRYLIRCGVPKENLMNIPREVLQMISPEYCGLCSQSFESFNVSRIHYISKNHTKAQRKWITQKFDGGPQRDKEPLRAREIYCELCDVQITSKAHADSHYSGRPHRAIVEGRKVTKNPSLLRMGMEGRVNQLIRREKKHLKNIEVEEAEKYVDPKTVHIDLYCEICKTAVTCTEQMTMHLNGKKHLTKEKQHILKMMKGEISDDESETGNIPNSTETSNKDTTVTIDDEEEEEEAAGQGDTENTVDLTETSNKDTTIDLDETSNEDAEPEASNADDAKADDEWGNEKWDDAAMY